MVLKIGLVYEGIFCMDVAVCWLVSSRFVYGARHTNNTVLSLFRDSNIDIFIFMVRAGLVLPRSLMTISSHETQCPRLKFGDYALRDHRGMILKHQVIIKNAHGALNVLHELRVTALWLIFHLFRISVECHFLLLKMIFSSHSSILVAFLLLR